MDKHKRRLVLVIKQLESQGFTYHWTRKGHLSVSKDGKVVTTFYANPGDHRSFKNSLARLRRAGFKP